MKSLLLKQMGIAGALVFATLIFAGGTGAAAQTADDIMTTATSTSTSSQAFTNILALPTGTTSAMISWTTAASSTSQVVYGTSSQSMTTYSELFPAPVTNHVVGLYNLLPDTVYHFMALSTNSSGALMTSDHQTFMTGSSTVATTTPDNDNEEDEDEENNDEQDEEENDNTAASTSDAEKLASIQAQIRDLYARLDLLSAQVQNMIGGGTGTTTGGNTNGTTTSTGMIAPARATMSPNATIDFNGRGFGREENVEIRRNNVVIGTAHADGGGNFSTGSMTIPANATGTLTYAFRGQSSNITGTSVITITR